MYVYDANGNLKIDPNRKVNFSYNYMNLPTVASWYDDGVSKEIEWLYDAGGMKLQKIVERDSVQISDRDYCKNIEYEGQTLDKIYHNDGYLTSDFDYIYYIRDNLGTPRVTFKNDNDNASIVSQFTPYPFGAPISELTQSFQSSENKYRFNGKEWNDDFGLDLYDFGARWLGSLGSVWYNPDPLASEFESVSPYLFGLGNPVRFIDPDGRAPMQPDDWVKTSSGAIVYDSKVTDKASAQERYGASAQYIGESAVFQDGSGNQVSLNENGRITQASFLNTVEVSASRTESGIGIASDVASKLDLATGSNTALIQGAIALSGGNTAQYADGLATLGKGTKLLGQATGIIGVLDSGSDFINNPTVGNSLKLAFDVGVTVAKINPVTGIVVGTLEVTGVKDNAAISIDRAVENVQYSNWLNSQTIKIK